MNKKRYTAPEMESLKVATQEILAGSSFQSPSFGSNSDSERPVADEDGDVYGD